MNNSDSPEFRNAVEQIKKELLKRAESQMRPGAIFQRELTKRLAQGFSEQTTIEIDAQIPQTDDLPDPRGVAWDEMEEIFKERGYATSRRLDETSGLVKLEISW